MLAHPSTMKPPAEAAESDSRELARRKYLRRRLDGIATAFELSGDHFGGMHTLRRIDYSDGGVGGLTDDVIAQGTEVTVGFQAPDCVAHIGRVITCKRCENGYRVGVAFE